MKRLLIIFALLTTMLAVPVTASAAYDPLGDACKAGNSAGRDSAACSSNGKDTITGKDGILMKAANLIARIGGVAAVIIIMIAGFRYVTSNGDAQKAAGARNAIIGAVVGLAIIATAEAIVIFVVRKL